MASHQGTPSEDLALDGNPRKRVCKACDRCRLKKSKCDGSHPCSRCRTDNAICTFGDRKKSHDRIYPKGYVEVLEQQQIQLVTCIQLMYQRMQSGEGWPGLPLQQFNGHPLAHDILARFELLNPKRDGSVDVEEFEENYHRMQQRLFAGSPSSIQPQDSSSSDSDYSPRSDQSSGRVSPNSKSQLLRDSFCLYAAPPIPSVQRSFPQQAIPRVIDKLYFPQGFPLLKIDPAQIIKPTSAIQTPQYDDGMGFYAAQFDPPLTYKPLGVQFNQSTPQGPGQNSPVSMSDWTGKIMGD
ncbi:Fluconazole resistance protein 1 [Elasticomyces elasticus]|nr:Fluconazole resistance protein 1 [Elasticomyces elasticus]